MNYLKIYNDLMTTRKQKKRTKNAGVYYENHHILPRSLGGTDERENLILLTAREHFVAHALLMKHFEKVGSKEKYKMSQAFVLMGRVCGAEKRKNSRLYMRARKVIAEELSKRCTGTIIVKDVKTGIRIGRVSNDHPKYLSGEWVFFHKGMKRSKEFKKKLSKTISGEGNPNARLEITKEYLFDTIDQFVEDERLHDGYIIKKWYISFLGEKYSEKYDKKKPSSQVICYRFGNFRNMIDEYNKSRDKKIKFEVYYRGHYGNKNKKN